MQRRFQLFVALVALLSAVWSLNAFGHGGVAVEDDNCIMSVGQTLRAHFTGYQPEARATQEFCEDIPVVGQAIFVIDYISDELRQMPTDFRVVRDVWGLGLDATWADLAARQEQIDEATLLYVEPETYSRGTFSVEYDFDEQGDYIGVVTAVDPQTEQEYISVFPFRVGIFHWGRILMPILLILGFVVVVFGFIAARAMNQRTA